MEDLFSSALGISAPWFISDLCFDKAEKRLDITLSFKRGSRFEVDGVLCPVHDTVKKEWRHLNFFEHECYLHARVPRVRTPDGGTILVMPPWSGKLHGFTLLFESLLIELCKHMPVNQVSQLVSVTNRRLWSLLYIYVAIARDGEDWSSVSMLGMDETSVAKGHDYISLFVDLEQRRTLHISPGKGQDTVEDFASELTNAHQGNPSQIKEVSCDMSRAFIAGVKKHLPAAAITFDKFHILKIINEGVDAVRRQESKEQPILKGKRYAVLKNDSNLNAKQQKQKEELTVADINLKTMEAVRMRENFQMLYQTNSLDEFIRHIHQWIKWVESCGLKPMEKVAHTIARHYNGIVQWKKSQINNGILEGLNSVIQAAKRKARGYKKNSFIIIAYLITGKLNFNNINKHCKPT